MTDSSDARPPISQPFSTGSAQVHSPVRVTLTLPPELVTALQQINPQLADQPLDQQILTLLQTIVQKQKAQQPEPAARSLPQELARLKQRLNQLEALLPRVASVEEKVDRLISAAAPPDPKNSALLPLPEAASSAELVIDPVQATAGEEIIDADGNPGSAVASIWMQIQQSDRPPASIPSTLQPSEPCPKCGQRLMPFKSLGGVRCIGCGWTDKPRERVAADGTNLDIHRLLEQAAVESEENMKPRKRSR